MAMVVNDGGDNGIFDAAIDNNNTMVVVAITSLVDGGSSDGHPCYRLQRPLMVAAVMVILAVAASAVNGSGGNGGLC
jgi:hypothetical protein